MDTPVAPGDVLLGKYRVERVLGQGGMGIVVAARHIELGQLYAIKFLLPAMLRHSEAVERFLREARAAARLQSDHVAKVHDVGRMENGAPYMVLEYLDGADLKVTLSRQGPLPIEDAVTYLLHVCDAISEAHAAGIVHRDLKPANLFLVRRRNGSPCVKVLDFGISKHTGHEEVDLTNTNTSLGTPLYMSPEQMSRTKAVDGRADIWALGVILYELLAGTSPFRAGTMLEVASKVFQEEPRPLRDLRPDLPVGFEDVIARCLRKQREERFATIEEFVEALQEFAARPSGARLPMSSVTNLEAPSANDAVPIEPPTIPLAAVFAAPGAGERTAITFGQTGKPFATKPRRSMFVAAITGAMLVLVVGGWIGWRSLSEQNHAVVAASVEQVTAISVSASSPMAEVVPDVSAEPREEVVQQDKPVAPKEDLSEEPKANVVVDKPKSDPVKPPVVSPVKVVRVQPAQTVAPTPTETAAPAKKRRTAE